MIPAIDQTPPLIAWALGFFMALSLKRERIELLLNNFLPADDNE